MSGIRLSLLTIFLLITVRAQAGEPLDFRGKTLEQWRADLHSAHPEIRKRAATALGLGPFGNSAVPALLEAMKDDEVRSSALAALIRLGPNAPDAAPALVPLIQTSRPFRCGRNWGGSSNGFLRVSSIAPSRIPLLLDRVRKERGQGRALSITFLDGADPSAVPLLRAALADECVIIREAASYALARLGGDAASAVPELLRALNDSSSSVRRNAINALGSISSPEAVPALATLLLGEEADPAARALAAMGPKGLAVLRQAYHGGSIEERLQVLSRIHAAKANALPLLLDGLGRQESALREAAAEALASSGVAVDRDLPRLIDALSDDSPKVRLAILKSLAEVVPPRRDVVLAAAGRLTDTVPEVREAAAGMLRQLGRHARPSIPLLFEGVRHRDADIRERSVKLLAEIAPPGDDLISALCGALKDDSPAVRWEAAAALGNLGPGVRKLSRAEGEKRFEVVVPALLNLLRDRQPGVRIAVADALLKIGYYSDGLIEQLGQEVLDPWPRLLGLPGSGSRRMAAAVLQRLGLKAAPAMPLLMLALHDGDTEVIEPLGEMGPAARRALPAFERMLDRSTEYEVQKKIALALVQIGGEGPGIVRARLDGRDVDLTVGLLAGLRNAGSAVREFLPDVLRLTEHSSERVRWAAIGVLEAASARDEDVRCVLLRALRDVDEDVRLAAGRALGAMGPEAKSAIPLLTDLLIHGRADYRQAIVEALGRIGPEDRQAFPALVETLTDPDEGVRKAVVEALVGAGPIAVPALRSACRDRSEAVRVTAAYALYGMKGCREEAGRVLRSVMLQGKQTGDQIEACLALWKQERTREVVPVLCLILRDSPSSSDAVEALCKLDGALDDVRAFVKPLLRHELRGVRTAAWQVLHRISPDLFDDQETLSRTVPK